MPYLIIESSNPFQFAPVWSKSPPLVSQLFGTEVNNATVRTFGVGGNTLGGRVRKAWSKSRINVWKAVCRNAPTTVNIVAGSLGVHPSNVAYLINDFVELGLCIKIKNGRAFEFDLTPKGKAHNV